MNSELTDQQLAALIATVCGKTGQGQAVVDEFAVQGGKNSKHKARITKGGLEIKGKVLRDELSSLTCDSFMAID